MRDEGLYLDDILEAAESIKQFTGNLKKEDFLESDLVQSAILQKLTVIGEAAARITEETRSSYPQIQWRSITGLRNIAVHVYYTVDWNMIWEIVQSNIPQLKTQIAEIIAKDFPLPDGSESD